MRYISKLPLITRPMFLTSVILTTGMVLFAAYAWSQQPTQERPVWDVQLARNAQASSNITIQNQCQRIHTFTVIEQRTPYIQLLAAPTVKVPGNSSYNLPVRFNTNGMNAGQYQGNIVVKCETCRKEKTCTQDREVLPVRLTVLQENAPPVTPENPTQAQVPGPPILRQDKPRGLPTPTPTPGPTAPGYKTDGEKAKITVGGNTTDDKREFDDNFYASYKLCSSQTCDPPQVEVYDPPVNGKSKKMFCPINENCQNCTAGALCRLFYSSKGDPKDKWHLITGGVHTFDPKDINIYACACVAPK
jgi:hypothetical protein